ncbi:hypothetical protein ACFOY8_12695 [Thalassospira xianhensis]|nr:hypothetical protein [Thalassospira xianhensis]
MKQFLTDIDIGFGDKPIILDETGWAVPANWVPAKNDAPSLFFR